MYGDPTTIRALARRLHERAEEIHDLAASLTSRAAAVPWSGLAADAMRAHVALQVVALQRTATLHDDAAEALERHAGEVDRLQGLLAAVGGSLADLGDLAGKAKELLP